MLRPAFIVEGRMEQIILQKTCANVPVVLINCNGDDVAISAMGRFIDVQARLLKRYDPKIIICDREGRRLSADEMAAEIKSELRRLGSPGSFIVGVADREFENWILAGLPDDFSCDFFTMSAALVQEGSAGKSKLRKGLMSKSYHATSHGPYLFNAADTKLMRNRSVSAASLLRQLKPICPWLD